jgi:hypothetical protein
MRYADVNYVWETSNTVLDTFEFNSTGPQEAFQFTHRRGIVLRIIQGEMSDLKAGQYAAEY